MLAAIPNQKLYTRPSRLQNVSAQILALAHVDKASKTCKKQIKQHDETSNNQSILHAKFQQDHGALFLHSATDRGWHLPGGHSRSGAVSGCFGCHGRDLGSFWLEGIKYQPPHLHKSMDLEVKKQILPEDIHN